MEEKIKLMYEIEVRNEEGKLIKRISGMSKSLLKNFMKVLRGTLYGGLTSEIETILDRDNVSHAFPNLYSNAAPHMSINATSTIDDYGIIVGTGDTPVDVDDVDLESPISHGTGSGQLLYGSTTIEEVQTSDSTSSFRVTRSFSNSSGASITVKEIGMAIKHSHRDDGDLHILIARDVLPSPTSIPDGASLTVRYTWSVSA